MDAKPELREQVKEAATVVGGRKTISCARALKLAEETGAPPADIGRICTEEKIRITGCQLGCF